MKIDNALSMKYLQDFPAEAARTLEQVAAKDVAALFSELPVQVVVPVVSVMLPEKTAVLIEFIEQKLVGKLLSEMPVPSAARVYSLLNASEQELLQKSLTDKKFKQIYRYLKYPSLSVGALMDVRVDVLPVNITVADAIRRIEHLPHASKCEIYIVNDAYQLQGIVELGRLLTSNHHALLRDIMIRKAQPVSVHALADSLLTHPGWKNRRRLPVVERDNSLLGVLEYNRLYKVYGDNNKTTINDPVENVLSLTHLYWLSLVQFIDSLVNRPASVRRVKKGAQQ